MQTSSATPCPDCGEPTPTGGWVDQRARIAELEDRPTRDAYDAACKALMHWRHEAKRLGVKAGEIPVEMPDCDMCKP